MFICSIWCGLWSASIFVMVMMNIITMSPQVSLWFVSAYPCFWIEDHGSLTRYPKLRVAHALGMPGTLSPPPWVSDPNMHHGTCVTHVPWCMLGSLTCGFLWSRWRGKRSWNSWHMRNLQFCVSGKRPIHEDMCVFCFVFGYTIVFGRLILIICPYWNAVSLALGNHIVCGYSTVNDVTLTNMGKIHQ